VPAATPEDRSGDDRSTQLRRVELHHVRPFVLAELVVEAAATTVLVGPNGAGKTTILEAVGFLGSQRSFRTANRDAMVRSGSEMAVIRAELAREGRPLSVDTEIRSGRSPRTLLNGRATSSRAAIAQAVPVTIFSPEELGVVQGPPARRRELLDAALRLVDHRAAADLDELERVLRQRGALLHQAGGKLTSDVATTLEVWDARLSDVGERVALARHALAEALEPFAGQAYADLAGAKERQTAMAYRPSWAGSLADALVTSRTEDLRRGVSTVGPHRDDLELRLGGRDARTHASQGEQRTISLALRLGVHRLVTVRTGAAPILLLDDVFSELDPDRSLALVRHLPAGQALVTTAATLPDGLEVATVIDVRTLTRDVPP
jgi:DNA replication and repair protein RecF